MVSSLQMHCYNTRLQSLGLFVARKTGTVISQTDKKKIFLQYCTVWYLQIFFIVVKPTTQ